VQFTTFVVGNLHRTVSTDVVLSHHFTLNLPATSVYAMLQGFHVQFVDPDHRWARTRIAITPRFRPGDSAGIVDVTFSFPGDRRGAVGPRKISALVSVLLIGT
jgi:hypothetical protein